MDDTGVPFAQACGMEGLFQLLELVISMRAEVLDRRPQKSPGGVRGGHDRQKKGL